MSASQTLHLIEKSTKANIPKETATELLEFVEQAQTDAVSKNYVDARFRGLTLFVGFNTALLIAVLAKLFLG